MKLAQKSGRPVKMVMTREEVFRATGPASGTVNTVKIGCTKDGRIVAMYAKLIYESGAYPGSPLGAGSMCIFAPYAVDDMLIEGYEVVVNRPRVAAYRAPGAPQSMFAGESVLDELAQIVGMDPIDFRLQNAAKEGTHASYGPTFGKIGLRACLEAAKAHPNYAKPLAENAGRGLAVGFWFNGANQSSAEVHVAPSGMVKIVEGSPDIGGSRASMALMAAETLGVPYERMRVRVADTDSTGYCATTGGSRVTFATGMAVIRACEDVIGELKRRAALSWGIEEAQVEWAEGEARPAPGVNVDAQAAHPRRTRPQRGPHRRADLRPRIPERARTRAFVLREHGGRAGRQGDRPGHCDELYRDSRRRQGDPPRLRGRPDAGRRGAGHRLGAERGVHLRCRWRDGEPRLPGLPRAGCLGLAHDRNADHRSAECQPSLMACVASARRPSLRRWRQCATPSARPSACA